MKKLFVSVLLAAFFAVVHAQYNPQVSHFMYDNLRTNPGSAGSLDMVNVGMLYRNQMLGFPGNPNTFIGYAETPFNLLGTKHGVGIAIYNDAIGFDANISFDLNYAYRFTVGDGTLGIGLKAQILSNEINGTWVPMDEGEQLPQGQANNMPFSLGAGLFYRTEDIYFGLSSVQINEPSVEASAGSGTNQANEFFYNLSRHYYVTAGYNMQLSNPAWELKPGVLLKSDGTATDMDLNLTCLYNKKFWGGVSYRTGAAIVGMIGFEIMDGIKIGYSYDFATSALTNESDGSHEFFVNYAFKLGVEKAPQKYKSIRFL